MGWAQACRYVGSSEQTTCHVARVDCAAFAAMKPECVSSSTGGGGAEGRDAGFSLSGAKSGFGTCLALGRGAYVKCVGV